MNVQCSESIFLDGDWDFTYEIDPGNELTTPSEDAFVCRMPVPGYWDDNIDRIEKTEFWSRDCRLNHFRPITFPLGQGKPPDCSLPYLIGVGWYRKRFRVGSQNLARLTINGAVMDVTVFVNGEPAGKHEGHLTPAHFEIGHMLKAEEENELLLAVSNLRGERASTVIRGYKGRSAGIYGAVTLHLSTARVDDLYIYPQGDSLQWQTRLKGDMSSLSLSYSLHDSEGQDVLRGEVSPGKSSTAVWETGCEGIAEWSDHTPNLYTATVELRSGDKVLDRISRPFGLRRIQTDGTGLMLNGRPVFLRGLTEHAYFPLTCTPPRDKEVYRKNILKLQALGFNYIRFHTWAPPEPYVQACDELGMLVQVEAPNGFSDEEWSGILSTYRKHPSVILYCCGNEIALDDSMVDRVEKLARECHLTVPDALFCPMHAMGMVDWRVTPDMPGVVAEPLLHHPQRLERLQKCSDVLAPQTGPLGIREAVDDLASVRRRMSIYRRPLLAHEMGIFDTYIDLDLENRYIDTRIGTDLYAGARAYLQQEGLHHRAPVYYENACRRVASLRKDYIEKVRLLGPVAGYDYLGAFDNHWHRTGYSVGILNEFLEIKPGESEEDVRRYNGENVLLCDIPPQRNFQYQDRLNLSLFASLYDTRALSEGTLRWALHDKSGRVYDRGQWAVDRAPVGDNTFLGQVSCTLPTLASAGKLTLTAQLSDKCYEVQNRWDIWLFPSLKKPEDNLIVTDIDETVLQRLSEGESLLLLGTGAFASLPHRILRGGRTVGTAATAIEDHPLMASFPHEGFCDWQFHAMLEGAQGVVLDCIPFKPIIEFVSSYKLIVKQAAVFEWQVGPGRLLVCSLNLSDSDPAAMYLLHQMLAYLSNERYAPPVKLGIEDLRRLMNRNFSLAYDPDVGQDGNALALLE